MQMSTVGPRRPHTPRGSAATHRSLTLPAATDTVTVGTSTAEKVNDTPGRHSAIPAALVEDHRMGNGPGAIRGVAQRGKNAIAYEVGSGLPYKISCTLTPEVADIVVTAARGANISLAGMINAAIAHMDVDENGVPTWYEPPDEQQQRLIA